MTEQRSAVGRRGTVASFDDAVGLGTIVDSAAGVDDADTAGVVYEFHCIEIADGSRSIDVGAEVCFDLLAKFGRWEAANIRPC